MHEQLSGRVAAITGGAGVLCGAFARALAAAGIRVALLDVDMQRATAVAESLACPTPLALPTPSAIAVHCNVLDRLSVEAALREVLDAFGQCDILINGAGGNSPGATTVRETFAPGDVLSYAESPCTPGAAFASNPENLGNLGNLSNPDAALNPSSGAALRPASDITPGTTPDPAPSPDPSAAHGSFFALDAAAFSQVFDLNVLGTVLPSQVFGPALVGRPGATIVNIASMNAYRPLTKIPAYSAGKAAVANFTLWLAVHLAEAGVRVNAIAPGFFETPQNYRLLRNADGTLTDRSRKILSHTPMRRFGVPEDLLGTLLWLCDDAQSGFVTGAVIPVDGGFSAYAGV